MANIYYVDSVNGSNDNDGTAPDKAWANIAPSLDTDASSADAPAIIYVRRNTEQSLDDDIDWSANPNRIIVGWPIEGEEFYDDRPSAGSDAGWDDDDQVKPKITINKTINAKTTSENQLAFYNMVIETSDDSSDNAILYSIGRMTFNNCKINHLRNDNSDSFVSFYRIDETNGELIVNVENCNIYFDGVLFADKEDTNWSEVKVTFNSLGNDYKNDTSAYGVWYWRASKTPHLLNLENDVLDVNRVFYFDEDNRNYALIELNVKNITATIANDLIYFRERYKLTAKIENSYIKNKNNYIIYQKHYTDTGYDYKLDVYIYNSTLEANSAIIYKDNAYSNDRNGALGDILFDTCTIRANYLFKSDDEINYYGTKFVVNKCNIDVNYVFYSDRSTISLEKAIVNIQNSAVRKAITRYGRNFFVTARNSSINFIGENSDTSSHNICSMIGTTLNGSYHADSITISGGSVSGEYPYSSLMISNSQVTLNEKINRMIVRNSKTSAIPNNCSGEIELFSCLSNDNPMPYAKINNFFSIKTSNILRVNGSDGSLEAIPNLNGAGFYLDKLSFVKPANKNQIVIYIASQNTTPENYEYMLNMSYVIDDEGYAFTSQTPSTVSITDESWSGLYKGYKSYILTFDVPVHDEDVNVDIAIQAFTSNFYAVPSSIYIDLKPDWN